MPPACNEYPNPSPFTKNTMPKSPNTIEGIPASVSTKSRTIFTNLLLFFAYSFK